jgi:lipopolysaccharide export system permease protein
MRILDRYIIKSFLTNYLLALGVMVGMYTLLDLIVNFDNFAKGANTAVVHHERSDKPDATNPGTATQPAQSVQSADAGGDESGGKSGTASAMEILGDMVDYYSYQLLVIFQQVSGAIPTLAAGFTMVRMTRHHELTAMLASGVSLYRVAAPIILVSMGIAGVHVLNQEFVLSQPTIIEKLLRKHDEVNQVVTRTDRLDFVVDSDGSLINARDYDPVKKQMKDVFIIQRDKNGSPLRHWYADTATWEVPPGKIDEEWVMRGVISSDDQGSPDRRDQFAGKIPMLAYKTNMSPDQLDLIFQKKAVDYLSSAQVHKLIEYSPEINKPMLYKIMHLRFTQPLMNLIMLLIGIPFLLTREPNRLVINMFYSTAVSGIVFIGTFVIFQMGGTQLDPLLAAWLPVLIFGPFALVMLDLIHT